MKTIIDYFNVLDDEEFFKYWGYTMRISGCVRTTLIDYNSSQFYMELIHTRLKKLHNLNPKPKQNPKIAVLITGQLRGDWEYILQKNIKNLIKPLNADMFLFSWDEVALWPGLRGNNPNWVWRNFSILTQIAPQDISNFNIFTKILPNIYQTIDKEIKDKKSLKALENYDFKGITLDDERKFEKDFQKTYAELIRQNTKEDWGTGKLLYGWNKALKLMQDYELKHNFQYDFVFIIRTDLEYQKLALEIFEQLNCLKDNEIVATTLRSGGICGGCNYGKRNSMIKCFSIWENKEIQFINSPYGYHAMLLLWLIFNDLSFKQTKIIYTITTPNEKLTFPDISKELQLDFEKLKQDGVSEEKLKDYRDFFELVCEYYKIEPEQRQNCISQHPCFLRLKEKKVKINSQQNSGAVLRVKNHLAYKLGNIMVSNNPKTFKEYKNTILRLIQAAKEHQIQREQQKGIKLPPLETLKDYEEALKIKNYFSYRLGEALIKAFKNIYFGGMIKFFFFDIKRIKKEFHKKQS
ncbi:hypothetical protein [Campylobacter cuniculorum]|nr:hypothetical protein [Campylobacter cuniculorum]QOR04443.1 hypothetical protein A0071_00350 [Campylobacter cuniculorum]